MGMDMSDAIPFHRDLSHPLTRSELTQRSYHAAKLQLERATNITERTAAIADAMRLGMPLCEIEQHLDWLDASKSKLSPG